MKIPLLGPLILILTLTGCAGYQEIQLPPSRQIDDYNQEIQIPVIVHVLYNNDKENVPDPVIDQMIDELQKDFKGLNPMLLDDAAGKRPDDENYKPKNTNIVFEKARSFPDGTPTTGIIRKKTTTGVFSYRKRKVFSESPPIDPYHFLNVYVCNVNSGTNAYTPTESANHGVVIDYAVITDLEKAHTLTHEAGHWLGLLHIFEGGCHDSDGIKDTPAQKKLNRSYKYGDKNAQCSSSDIMATNFMSYNTNRDFFSNDQIKAMRQFTLQYSKPDPNGKELAQRLKEAENQKGGPLTRQEQDAIALLHKKETAVRQTKEILEQTRPAFIEALALNFNMYDDYQGDFQCPAGSSVLQLTGEEKQIIASAGPAFSGTSISLSEQEQKTNAYNWQAQILNTLSMIMAEQAEKETFNLALNRFFKDIAAPGEEPDKINAADVFYALFPKTTAFIKQTYYSGNPYTGLDIASLQLHIKNDIKGIPALFAKRPEILLPKINNYPLARDLLTVTNEIIQSSSSGIELPEIVNRIAAKEYLSPAANEITGALAVISNGLRAAKDSDQGLWIDPLELSPFTIGIPDEQAAKIKLIYQLLYCRLSRFDNIKKYMDSGVSDVGIALKIQELLLFVNHLDDTYAFIKSKDFKLLTLEDQIGYARKISESLYQFTAVLLKVPELKLNEKLIEIPKSYLAIFEALLKKEYSNAMLLTAEEFGSYMNNGQPKKELLLIAAEIAADNDGSKIKSILKTYVEPIGTSALKRISPFNISLNGYAGLNAGYENIRDPHAADSWYGGVTAPIGVTLSFLPSSAGSWSVFFEVLDLGSLVNVRFKNDQTTYDDLRFEQFLSPGAGLFYNFKNTPLTVGGRWNYISRLRTITYNNGVSEITETGQSVSRISLSILIDIPLFTLFTKKRN